MRNILRLLGYPALFAAVATAAVAASGKSPVLRDGSHDMDFAIGTWRTDIVTIQDPFEHPDQTMHLSGTKTARQIWGGKAVIPAVAQLQRENGSADRGADG